MSISLQVTYTVNSHVRARKESTSEFISTINMDLQKTSLDTVHETTTTWYLEAKSENSTLFCFGIVWVFNSLFWYVLLHYYKLALSLKTDIWQSWALMTVYQL